MPYEFEQGRPVVRIGGCFSSILGMAMTCGIGGFVGAMLFAIPKSGTEEVVAAMTACPAVASALGTPIHVPVLSVGCGEEESGGGTGDASWTISVAGPRSSGRVSYRASYLGNGPWEIEAAVVVMADGRSISAVPCQGGSAPVRPAPPGGQRPDRGDDRGKGGKRR